MKKQIKNKYLYVAYMWFLKITYAPLVEKIAGSKLFKPELSYYIEVSE